VDPEWLYRESRALVSRQEYPSSLIRRKNEDRNWWEFFTDPESRFDAKEWRFAHAASFCFGARVLSDISYSAGPEDPYARLEDVQWFHSSSQEEMCESQVVMHHTLANAAVGVSDWNSEQRLEARQQSAKISKAPLVRQTQTASLCRRTWHLQFLFLLMDWTRSQHVIWLRQQPQHSLPTVTGPAISVLEETGAVFSMASVGEMSMWLKTCTALGVLHRLPL
jgi:hypothetical protein